MKGDHGETVQEDGKVEVKWSWTNSLCFDIERRTEMKTYEVTVIIEETYFVEADDEDEACEKAEDRMFEEYNADSVIVKGRPIELLESEVK